MQSLIDRTIRFVQTTLAQAEAGHDWFHIERVYKTALTLNEEEKGDPLVVALAALLHDIADPKFNEGDENKGPNMAAAFLSAESLPTETADHVVQIIRHMSFKNSFSERPFDSLELRIVQDADRLDAIGAIGIARAFTYGGYKNRVLYDPKIKPVSTHTKESYKQTQAPTINHFYEKLLLLKDRMNTATARKMAAPRHQLMLDFLEHFYQEWEGKNC